MFIGGLDEYAGDVSELMVTLKNMKRFKHVKLCLASRPHAEVLKSMGNPQFKLEDRNRATVQSFVHDSFIRLDHTLHELGLAISPEQSQRLQSRILEKAFGVFIWVRLVVGLVSKSLLSAHRVEQAYIYLESLPTDMFQLYQRIFEQFKEDDLQQAVVLIFVIRNYQLPEPWMDLGNLMTCYSFLMQEIHGQKIEYKNDTDVLRFYALLRFSVGTLVDFLPSNME